MNRLENALEVADFMAGEPWIRFCPDCNAWMGRNKEIAHLGVERDNDCLGRTSGVALQEYTTVCSERPAQ